MRIKTNHFYLEKAATLNGTSLSGYSLVVTSAKLCKKRKFFGDLQSLEHIKH